MKLRHSLPWMLAAGAVAFLLWVSGGPALRAQQPAADAEEVLLGFDPILLIGGREELGEEALAVVHDGFTYLFVSEANRRTFLSDPARYGVQLGGLCARMGETTRGDADNYAVVDGRIYLFGSEDCRKRFTATPEIYLEPPAAPIEASAGAAARGRALVDEAVRAVGGADVVDRIVSYRLEFVQTFARSDGTVQRREGALSWSLPGRIRVDRVFAGFGAVADVLSGTDAFSTSPRGVESFRSGPRDALVRRLAREPLVLLKARHAPDFQAAFAGEDPTGGSRLALVEVAAGGVRARLGIDPGTGRLVTLSWIGRGPEGAVGRITLRYSDFREIDAVMLPFHADASVAGEPFAAQSWRATAIRVNAVTSDLFERPVTRN